MSVKRDFYECAYASAKSVEAAQGEMAQILTANGMQIVEVDRPAFEEAAKKAYEELGWTELREQLYKEAGIE